MTWLDTREDVLAFTRPGDFTCLVNLSAEPVDLPAHRELLLSSIDLDGGRLPSDAAVWLRTS
jgi:alpha-glucosidase